MIRTLAAAFLFLLVTVMVLPAQNLDMAGVKADEEFRWGVRAFHKTLYNEAILSFQRSLSFDSDRSLTHLWLGRAYYFSGFEDAALSQWQGLLDRGEGSPYLENLVRVVRNRRGLDRELTQPGRFVITTEVNGTQQERTVFQRPVSITPRSDGSFYVTSMANHEILRMGVNGNVQARLSGGLESFDQPFDLWVSADGVLYVSEFGGDRIAKCNSRGIRMKTFGGKGVGNGNLLGPQYITGDNAGYIYVTDWGNARVAKFDTDGNFILAFGGPAGGFQGLKQPTGVLFYQGRVYVADAAEKAIYIFDPSGNYLGSLSDIGLVHPEDLSVYREGQLLVSDSSQLVAVDIEDQTAALISEIDDFDGRITSGAIDANGNLVVADFQNNKIYFLARLSGLYTGLFVKIDRVTSGDFPEVYADVTVENRSGDPIVGLTEGNFFVTENRLPVNETGMVYATYKTKDVEMVALVDKSSAMRQQTTALRDFGNALLDAVSPTGRVRVVSAGETPVVETDPNASRISQLNAITSPEGFSGKSAFDLGVRLAGSELVSERARRAVVFVTDGTLPDGAFSHYGLQETVSLLVNNDISFYVVSLNQDAISPELDYLVRETGGNTYYLYQPSGIGSIVSDIQARKSGRYTLKFSSIHNSDFGRAYIPLEVETYLIRQSGRDEAGYFGPLEF